MPAVCPVASQGERGSFEPIALLDKVAWDLGQQVSIFLDVVLFLAICLLAVVDVAVVVPHRARRLQKGPHEIRMLEPALGGRAPSQHQRRHLGVGDNVLEAKVLCPGVMPVSEVAHLLRLLKGRVEGHRRVGAVALDEAVAGVRLRGEGPVLPVDRAQVHLLRRRLLVLEPQAVLHQGVGKLRLEAPGPQVRVPVLRRKRGEELPDVQALLAVEGGHAHPRGLCAVHVRHHSGRGASGGAWHLARRSCQARQDGGAALEEPRSRRGVAADLRLEQHGRVLQGASSGGAAEGDAGSAGQPPQPSHGNEVKAWRVKYRTARGD
mmetsp:Transcript_91709/g.243685  ORF Transcript_91709/g.243685 Transcript_91709/m.243685 type:complete len:321 (+) Transcript_91709:144-1106(+)